jgi:Ran GTPase-activating protein (RanGAP) involved in mRNA processing and transport
MPTWTKSAKKFKAKFVEDSTKTDPRFAAPVPTAPEPSAPINTFTTGFAPWQLTSSRFRPPQPVPKHDLYRDDVEYETWEEHYDDFGKMFYHNPNTGVSQWDVPPLIQKAIAADNRRSKRKEINEFYAYQQHQESTYGHHDDHDEQAGYWDEEGNWVVDENGAGWYVEDAVSVHPSGHPSDADVTTTKDVNSDQITEQSVRQGQGDYNHYFDDDYYGEDDNDDVDDYPDDEPDDSHLVMNGGNGAPADEDEDDTPPATASDVTGDRTMAEEIERTRARVAKINFVPKNKGEKKWAMLRGVKNVLTEVNEAGKLHDEDLVKEEEVVAVCSLLANATVSLCVAESLPRVALQIKKGRLKEMEEKNHANWKMAHADFKTNKVEVPPDIKVGSVEYLNQHPDEEDTEEGAGGEWDAYEDAKMEKQKKSALDAAQSVSVDATDGKSLSTLIEDLAKIGVESKKLARILYRLSHSKLGHAPLREIDLTNDPISDVGASCLATLLKTSSIVRLYLVNCEIGNVGAKAISQAALYNRSLMELYLNNNDLTDEGVRDIAVALGSSPTLKTLNLSSNRITEEGAKHIASMLVDPGCRLRSLFLSGRLDTTKQLEAASGDLDDDEQGEEATKKKQLPDSKRRTQSMFTDMSAGTLAVLETKRKLAKRKGRIGFMGAIYLSTALLAPHGCPLRNLTLVNCDLGPTVEGSKALAVALYANETLETLNISDNMIGAAGAEYITGALRVNKTLKKIESRNCGLSVATLARLREHLDNKEPLDWLDQKNLARSAVDMREWMLKIAQQNNFKFANQHLLEQEMDAKKKELDRENALQAEIETTTNKFKRGALKLIKQNVHQHAQEHDSLSSLALSTSKSTPSLTSSDLPVVPNAASFKKLQDNKRWEDYLDKDIDVLNTCAVSELDAAATRDLLLSCKKLHEASVICADECSKQITVLSTVIHTTKCVNRTPQSERYAEVPQMEGAPQATRSLRGVFLFVWRFTLR